MKELFVTMCAAAMFTACGGPKKGPESIVIYYSQGGTTEQVAKLIQEKTGADIAAIIPEAAYDGDFQATIERSQKERTEGTLTAILPLEKDIADYDIIYIGYPIWFGTYAIPVQSFLKDLQVEGKTIIPFCTFGSGGLESSTEDLKKALPGATFLEGYGVRAARVAKASEELDRFLVGIGAVKGEAEQLPAFGESSPVAEEDIALFNEACGDYQMPLGVPVEVAKRNLADATEYKFEAESPGPDGSVSKSVIYVVKGQEGRAEFTRVVR